MVYRRERRSAALPPHSPADPTLQMIPTWVCASQPSLLESNHEFLASQKPLVCARRLGLRWCYNRIIGKAGAPPHPPPRNGSPAFPVFYCLRNAGQLDRVPYGDSPALCRRWKPFTGRGGSSALSPARAPLLKPAPAAGQLVQSSHNGERTYYRQRCDYPQELSWDALPPIACSRVQRGLYPGQLSL